MSGDDEQMRAFWDEKARENPLWYIYSGLEYHAPDEERFWSSGEEDVEAVLREAGVTEATGTAIDIGCGVGRLTRALAQRFEHAIGFDISPQMVELARERNHEIDNLSFTPISTAGILPVETASASFVLTLQVLQHIPSRAVQLSYIREAGRVLRPGGVFAFQLRSVLRADSLTGAPERAARSLVEHARRLRNPPAEGIDSPAWAGARLGLWEVKAATRAGGLIVRSTRWISRRGASLMVIATKS